MTTCECFALAAGNKGMVTVRLWEERFSAPFLRCKSSVWEKKKGRIADSFPALPQSSVGVQGLPSLLCSMDEAEDMHSLLLTDSSTLLVGGLQNHVIEIDLNTVQETQKVPPGTRPVTLHPVGALVLILLLCVLPSTPWRYLASPS